jgi:hypothetical protein
MLHRYSNFCVDGDFWEWPDYLDEGEVEPELSVEIGGNNAEVVGSHAFKDCH